MSQVVTRRSTRLSNDATQPKKTARTLASEREKQRKAAKKFVKEKDQKRKRAAPAKKRKKTSKRQRTRLFDIPANRQEVLEEQQKSVKELENEVAKVDTSDFEKMLATIAKIVRARTRLQSLSKEMSMEAYEKLLVSLSSLEMSLKVLLATRPVKAGSPEQTTTESERKQEPSSQGQVFLPKPSPPVAVDYGSDLEIIEVPKPKPNPVASSSSSSSSAATKIIERKNTPAKDDDNDGNDDDDDEVMIVDPVKPEVVAAAGDCNNGNDEEIQLVGSTGISGGDMPHPRIHCVRFKFSVEAGPQQEVCANCYCLVCQKVVSECTDWGKHWNAKNRHGDCEIVETQEEENEDESGEEDDEDCFDDDEEEEEFDDSYGKRYCLDCMRPIGGPSWKVRCLDCWKEMKGYP